jgi:hypothetical protein
MKNIRFVCLAMLASAMDGGGQTNPIQNPGFETWSSGAPDQWTCAGKSYIRQETQERYAGGSSVCILVPSSSSTVELTQDIPVAGGGTYSFYCRVLDNTSVGELALLINWRSADASLSTKTSAHSSDQEGWQIIGLTTEKAPDGAVIARVRIRGYKQAGAGGGNCFADETAFSGDVSLAVHMSRLDAVRVTEGIEIRWSTESEINTIGFWIGRAESPEGPFERVNGVLIPGSGTGSSRKSYSFIDRNIGAGKSYWYRLEEQDGNGDLNGLGTVEAPLSDISRRIAPSGMTLRNYPNPFNPCTTVFYSIPAERPEGVVRVEIFDLLGREIRVLADGFHRPGNYTVLWDGRDGNGKDAASGAYFCRVGAEDGWTMTRLMLKMK